MELQYYLIKYSKENNFDSEIISNYDVLIENCKKLNDNPSFQSALVHVGYERPYKDEIINLLKQYEKKIFVTESAKSCLPTKDIKISLSSLKELLTTPSLNELKVYPCLKGLGFDCTLEDIKSLEEEGGVWIGKKDINNPNLTNDVENWLDDFTSKEDIFDNYLNYKNIGRVLDNYDVWIQKLEKDEKYLFKGLKDLLKENINKPLQFITSLRQKEISTKLEEKLLIGQLERNFSKFLIHETVKEDLQFRFSKKNPFDILPLLPQDVLNKRFNEILIPVRLSNCLISENIVFIKDLLNINIARLQVMPNMGIKSIDNLSDILIEQIDKDNDYIDSKKKLIDEIKDTLKDLESKNETHKKIFVGRLGWNNETKTLDQIAQSCNPKITRERVRQIEKKIFKNVILENQWDDVLVSKIDHIISGRNQPLSIHYLQINDPWFEGFENNETFLANLITMCSDYKYKNFEINYLNQNVKIITKIDKNDFDEIIENLIKDLKNFLNVKLSRKHIMDHCKNVAKKNLCEELGGYLYKLFENKIVYDKNEIISGFYERGKYMIEIKRILEQSEKPLHFTKITKEINESFNLLKSPGTIEGAIHGVSTAQNLLNNDEVFILLGRGVYGLRKHINLSYEEIDKILNYFEYLFVNSNNQIHSDSILTTVKNSKETPKEMIELSKKIDKYLLTYILKESKKLDYVGRDSFIPGTGKRDTTKRVEIVDKIEEILKRNGGPMSGNDLKKQLLQIRGLGKHFQINETANIKKVLGRRNYWVYINS